MPRHAEHFRGPPHRHARAEQVEQGAVDVGFSLPAVARLVVSREGSPAAQALPTLTRLPRGPVSVVPSLSATERVGRLSSVRRAFVSGATLRGVFHAGASQANYAKTTGAVLRITAGAEYA